MKELLQSRCRVSGSSVPDDVEPLRVSAGGSIRFEVDRGLLEEHASALGLGRLASALLEDPSAAVPARRPSFLEILRLERPSELSEELERAHATGRRVRALIQVQQRLAGVGEPDRYLHVAETIYADWRSGLSSACERRAQAFESSLQQLGRECNREGFSAALLGELDRTAANVRAWVQSHRATLLRIQDRERRREEQVEANFESAGPSEPLAWEALLLAAERDMLEAAVDLLDGVLETLESIVSQGNLAARQLREIRDSAFRRADGCAAAAQNRSTPSVESLVSARLVAFPGETVVDYAKAALKRATARLGRTAFSDVVGSGFDQPLLDALQVEMSADLRLRIDQPVGTIWLSRFRDAAAARQAIHDLAARCGSGRRPAPDARIRLHGRLVLDAASAAHFERHFAGQLPPGYQIDDAGSTESFVVWAEELNVSANHMQVLEKAVAAAEALRSDRDQTPFLQMFADIDLAAAVGAGAGMNGLEGTAAPTEEN